VDNQSVRQMQGAVDLLRDATVAGSVAIGEIHARTAGVPYAVLKHIPLARGPAGRIEKVQSCITVAVYQSIHTFSTLSAFVAKHALDTLVNKTAGEGEMPAGHSSAVLERRSL
jgi:uncharacterized protein (DUF2236 family)